MGILTVSLKPPLSSSLLHSNPFLVFVSSPRWNSSRGGGRVSGSGGGLRVVAYMERNPNSAASIASKLIGALPVVGLIARIFSDEGGVGDDIVDFAEFRRRVGKKCGITDSQAFYEFKDRRGRAGDPLYVLLCCWLAAVGAGLLKSEEILEGVARLRISNDIEFEEETFIALMTSAKEKRAKSKAQTPDIPMEIRVEKALEAIFVCCFGQDPVEEEDAKLLCIMLNGVFPSVGRSNIDSIVSSMAKKLSAGERSYTGQKTLSKEAAQRQMKDLEFLRQNREN